MARKPKEAVSASKGRGTAPTDPIAAEPGGKAKGRRSTLHVVGIGASAGGLEALRPFVANLPASANMAYVIVQHLSPAYRSMMVQLLGRETKLPVEEIKDGQVLVPNTIYITPPNKDVRVKNSTLWLREPSAPLGPKPSVDVFFASLAEDRGQHAIGVILSGTGSDGAHGMRAIKACGGLTVAQDPETAKYDGMPKSAIDSGCVDMVLPPDGIGPELASISRFPRPVVQQKSAESETRDTITEIFLLVRKRTEVDFTQYKPNTVRRRLERRMAANRIETLDAYLDFVQRHPSELDLLCKDILISVTSFFRDTKAFDEVKATLADLLTTKKPGDSIRIWVPACATGEEAYSFAMMLNDLLGEAVKSYKIQVFATDIDLDAMRHARKGTYSATTVENLDKSYVSTYFDAMGQNYQVKKPIREMVVFARQDLIKDPPFVKVDLISCRNVLIYFNTDLQDRIFQVFHYALLPDGHLFLGKSESVGRCADLFRPVKASSKIFQKRMVAPRSNNPVFGAFRPKPPELPETGAITGNSIEALVRDGFVEACMPPSVAINENLDILYYHGDVDGFVRFPQGRPNQNLGKLIADDFRIDLRALVHRARETATLALGTRRQLRTRDGDISARLAVRPLKVDGGRESLFLVCCEKVEAGGGDAEAAPAAAGSDIRLIELEQELTATREHLQTVVEELETSNEELQALNEEMQAANEELQSSNEELETSNEELQSTNEELTTVNEELQVRTTELAGANADLQNIQDNVGFPMLVVDKCLRITRFTPPAARMFGLLPSDAGQLITAVPSQFHVKDLRAMLLAVTNSGVSHEEIIEADGRLYRMGIYPYRDLREQNAGTILTFIDETELRTTQKELEATIESLRVTQGELRVARDHAEAANRAKSEFLANMSHELRTPLNAVLGFAQIMADEMWGELGNQRYKEYVGIIVDSGQHLLSLISQVLDMSVIEAGRATLREGTVKVADVIASSIRLLSSQAEERSIRLGTRVPDDLPWLKGDLTAVQRVMLNLLGNALKFTPTGGSVHLTAVSDSDGMSISVTDTGIGIKAADIARVLMPFEQGGQRTLVKEREGVGLGLPISKSLMELHGGSLGIESAEGRGTTVTVRFPAERLLPPL
ncbi:chemotaxis protein CheB [Magnetospirillum sp. SS-4]|uniref:chemotaxis protein CheB n=1 Tax=Magnetospirillum sp. SS-4 TaxID=2681465 RepID=UPI00137D4D48|nr:chemotaxis protein CheB [Magnetospirillum sp. SS-4]CAA7616180.1 putative two-component sensor histidine kinase, classical system [Magnetospirillum sp. SS-4]